MGDRVVTLQLDPGTREARTAAATAALRSVACLLTSGPTHLEAVRQAAALATGGRLTLIDVHPRGADSRARLTGAWRIATAHGLEPEVRIVHAPPTAPTVLLLAAGHDLLVVGGPRFGLDGPSRAAIRQAPVPVLVARPRADDAAVSDRLLVATDGSPEAGTAVSIARAIAERHGSALVAVVPASEPPSLTVLDLSPGAARSPVGTVAVGTADGVADAIVEAGRMRDATLVVVGSRGLSGIAALESVSARVAERAACSVLVTRPLGG